MKEFLKIVFRLFRIENLSIIILTQYLTRFFIIQPILNASGTQLVLHEGEFAVVVLATLLIAAAGYIINDYFDMGIDRVNRPDRLIIGRKVKRKSAILLHFLINSIAMLFVAVITYRTRSWAVALVFFSATVILWFYSAYFKRMYLTGNVVVSLLLSIVMAVAWLPEYLLINAAQHKIAIATINLQIIFYSFFALMISFIRELIKDIEDYRGDKKFGCRTFPVVAGVNNARLLSFILAFMLTIIFIGFSVLFWFEENYLMVGYIFLFLIIPMAYTAVLIRKIKKDNKKAGTVSILIKIVTLLGILSMLLVNYKYL